MIGAACAFFFVSLYVKLRELVVTQEYHDALHLTGLRSRFADAWFSVVFSRDEALCFLIALLVIALLRKFRPVPGQLERATITAIAWVALPLLSALEIFGLSYYVVYQTPFPAADLAFARWTRELLASAGTLSSPRVLIGLAFAAAAYPAAALVVRVATRRTTASALRGVTAFAMGVLLCGALAPRPALAGSLLSPQPVVWFFVGHRPSFDDLPPDEVLAPIGPAYRAFDVARRPKNVVIVILESTPADAVFPYNTGARAGRRLLEMFPDDVTVLDHVYTGAPFSARSFASVAFGERPWPSDAGPPGAETLMETLARHGVRTEMYLNADAEVAGFSTVARRGVDRFLDVRNWPGQERYAQLLWGRDDRLAFDELARFTSAQRTGAPPFFVVVATNNPHAPYEVAKLPGMAAASTAQDAHEALVAYDFDLFADFYSRFRTSAIAEDTAFLVFGDHGEAFDQHIDNIVHSKDLYDENVHVACMLIAPGRLGLPARIAQLGSLQDVRATVLDLIGLSGERPGHGLPWLFEAPSRVIFAATDYGPGQIALRDARYTYLLWPTSGHEALFDRQVDPDEHIDISAKDPGRIARFREHLPSRFWSHRHGAS